MEWTIVTQYPNSRRSRPDAPRAIAIAQAARQDGFLREVLLAVAATVTLAGMLNLAAMIL
jgi:hypothetical protein